MKTLQKTIKFSKGMMSEELLERSDLESYYASANMISNCVSTVYGGIKSRSGTRLISAITAGSHYQELSPTVSGDCGGNVSDISTLTPYLSDTIGQHRTLAILDLQEQYNQSLNIEIQSIALKETKVFDSATAGTTVQNLMAGRYDVKMVGAGGGGVNLMLSGVPSYTLLAGGGSGSFFDGTVDLSAGTYDITVGMAAGNYRTNNWTYDYTTHQYYAKAPDGGTSSLGDVICCGGGKGGYILKDDSAAKGKTTPGAGGQVSYQQSAVYQCTGAQNGLSATPTKYKDHRQIAYGGTSVYDGWGSGGTVVSYYQDIYDSAPTSGYVCLDYASALPASIWVSDDGDTYQKASDFFISRESGYYKMIIDPAQWPDTRYVKIQLDTPQEVEIPFKISFQYVKICVCSGIANVKAHLRSFVFNTNQSYILVLTNECIYVFYQDVLQEIVPASGLLEAYLDTVKTAQSEDTMIFTHPQMHPKQLQRTAQGWTWQDLPLQNIPYYAFGGETKTAKTSTLTPSADEGQITLTSNNNDFTAESVGQYVVGGGGRIKITEYISPTCVGGYTIIPLYTAQAFSSWDYMTGYEAVWSNARGWPTTCLFAQQRLWFGGSQSCPSSLWASRVNLYNDFKNAGNYDNDAIHADLITHDEIVNLIENRGIHIFTTGSEWSAAENALTPNSFGVIKNTQNGSLKTITPVVIDSTVLFIERHGKSLLGYNYDYNRAAYITDNLSLLSNLIQQPVALSAEINSSQDKGDFIYTVLNDGSMLITCLVLSQRINSTAFFETSGRVLDVCCLNSETYLLVQRDSGCYLEKIGPYLTDATTVQTLEGRTVNMLNVYDGEKVALYDMEHRLITQTTVFGGQVVLDKPLYGSYYLGILYDFEVISNPIVIGGQSFSLKKRLAKAVIYTKDTPSLCFCGQTKAQSDPVYHFYGLSGYQEKTYFTLTGQFRPIHILSVVLTINY